jgi:FdhD protein
MDGGAIETQWLEYGKGWSRVQAEVIGEILLSVYVNGQDFASIMSTPRDQAELALGFLKNEGVLDRMDQVQALTLDQNGCCVEVWLDRAVDRPKRQILTSGCGGGTTFHDPTETIPPIEAQTSITPVALVDLMGRLHSRESLHARAGGVHTAGLSDGREILVSAEDVGRHNTIDKLTGMCMLRVIPTPGLILLTTGRISSEMLRKGGRMGCPIIASRNSPTSLAVAMAQSWNITLVGYVRRSTLRVYTHPERLGYRPAAG